MKASMSSSIGEAGTAPRTTWEWARLVGNAVNLSTPLGLGVALLGRARIRAMPGGLYRADGYRPRFPLAGAFTIGNVIITARPDWDAYDAASPRTLVHEQRHTWQWLICGPLFLPAYALSLGWSWLRTGNQGSANVFERLAGLADGGYPDLPRRPLRIGLESALRTARAATTRSRSLHVVPFASCARDANDTT